MSGKKQIYKTWEETITYDKKGDRVIQYHLFSTSASPLLAAASTTRCGRQYVYRVSKEFLETFGSSPTINALTKWTAREHVRDWLVSFVRNDNLSPTKPDHHNVPTQEDNGSLDGIEGSESIGAQEQEPCGGSLDAIEGSEPIGVQEQEPTGVSLDAIEGSEPIGVQEQEPSGGIQLPEAKASQPTSFQVGDNLELLSQDLHLSGGWYRCKIIEISKRFLKIQYTDLKDGEGSGNLEQYIRPPRFAPADELSTRQPGRHTIRPCPPEEESPTSFEVGTAVDAWWNNGWWEGFVLTGVSLSNNDHYHVFFPGLRRFLVVRQEDLRVSREWVDDRWVPIDSQSDILSFVFSYYK